VVAYQCSQEEKVRGSSNYHCVDRWTFLSSGMMPRTPVYILTNIYEEPGQFKKSKLYRENGAYIKKARWGSCSTTMVIKQRYLKHCLLTGLQGVTSSSATWNNGYLLDYKVSHQAALLETLDYKVSHQAALLETLVIYWTTRCHIKQHYLKHWLSTELQCVTSPRSITFKSGDDLIMK
jgi:hypothetical protein